MRLQDCVTIVTTISALKRKGEPLVISVELVQGIVFFFARDTAVRMLEATRIEIVHCF